MLIAYILLAVAVICFLACFYDYYRKPRKRKLLLYDNDNVHINLEYAVMFDINSLSKKLNKAINNNKDLEYVTIEYLQISRRIYSGCNSKKIQSIIASFQQDVIEEYFDINKIDTGKDIILQIWLYYSGDLEYRKQAYVIIKRLRFNQHISLEQKDNLVLRFSGLI